MKEVGDSFDIMVSVIALILVLTVCAWSIAALRANSEVLVDEKTSLHNVDGLAVEKPTHSAKDALMSLVVNDAYVPDPATVVFQLGRETYTVVFDNAYFKDKEVSINKAWKEFFHNKMSATVTSTTLDAAGTRWLVQLTP